jgi:hypothetical protein
MDFLCHFQLSCRHTQVMLQTVTLFYIHCGCDDISERCKKNSSAEISEITRAAHQGYDHVVLLFYKLNQITI